MFRAMTAIGAALLLAACVACGGTDSGNESDVVTTDVTPVDVIEAATDTVPEIVLDTIVKTDTVKPEAVIQETTEVADVPAGCPAAVWASARADQASRPAVVRNVIILKVS